jgi:hypothetical protein
MNVSLLIWLSPFVLPVEAGGVNAAGRCHRCMDIKKGRFVRTCLEDRVVNSKRF